MLKNSFLFLIGFLFICSCGSSGVRINKSHLKPFHTNFTDTFINKPCYYKGNGYRKNITDILLLNNYKTKDTVILAITENKELQLTFKDSLNTITTKTFQGRFNKKGLFEINHYKNRVFIPLLYGKTDINRVRIGLTNSNNLFIDHYVSHTGNVFIFSAGRTYRDKSLHKAIRNPDSLLEKEKKPSTFILMTQETDTTVNKQLQTPYSSN